MIADLSLGIGKTIKKINAFPGAIIEKMADLMNIRDRKDLETLEEINSITQKEKEHLIKIEALRRMDIIEKMKIEIQDSMEIGQTVEIIQGSIMKNCIHHGNSKRKKKMQFLLLLSKEQKLN
jgi:hypothetical protein